VRVRCVRLIDPIMLEVVSELVPGERQLSGWLPSLRTGQEYVVLAFTVDDRDQALLRIDAGESPGLYDRRMFVTVSDRIPSNWVATLDELGRVEFGPAIWQHPGFWDAYFSGEPDAVGMFRQERQKIRMES
jgi:hypothetical protein